MKHLNRANQVRTQTGTGIQKSGSLFQRIGALFSDAGGMSTNSNTAGQATPVAFGTQAGWNDKGQTKGWNRSVTLKNAGGKAAVVQEQSYALQQWTGNPYAAGKSGAPYASAAQRGGVPLELQPNPLTVVRTPRQVGR